MGNFDCDLAAMVAALEALIRLAVIGEGEIRSMTGFTSCIAIALHRAS
jgi:hypothetical protein